MFIFTAFGLILCLLTVGLSLYFSYKAKPDGYNKLSDKLLFTLFNLSIASSVWGMAAQTDNSFLTLFRISFSTFLLFYIVQLFIKKENPLKNLKKYEYSLFYLLGFMLIFGVITLLFLSADKAYTFSRLFNLSLDILLCVSIILYLRKQDMLYSIMINLSVTLLGLFVVGIYESFFGVIYTDTHIGGLGPTFMKLFDFFIPSGPFYNTNDFSTSIGFLSLPVIIYWLYRFFYSNSNKAKLFFTVFISLIFSLNWFICHTGGAVINQIGLIIFYSVFILCVSYTLVKNKVFIHLFILLIPLLFAVFLQYALTANLSSLLATDVEVSATESTANDSNSIDNNSSASEGNPIDNSSTESSSAPDPVVRDDFTGIGTGNDAVFNKTIDTRVTLLKFAFQTFIDNPLGAGLGNTQAFAQLISDSLIGGIYKIHCYIAECIADFGIVFILVSFYFVFTVIKAVIQMIKKNQTADTKINNIFIVLLLTTFASAVFLSTAPSTAQDLKAMWIYIALVLLIFNFLNDNKLNINKKT